MSSLEGIEKNHHEWSKKLSRQKARVCNSTPLLQNILQNLCTFLPLDLWNRNESCNVLSLPKPIRSGHMWALINFTELHFSSLLEHQCIDPFALAACVAFVFCSTFWYTYTKLSQKVFRTFVVLPLPDILLLSSYYLHIT